MYESIFLKNISIRKFPIFKGGGETAGSAAAI